MPNLMKDILKCKHPNSRKTKALAKKTKRMNNREKIKLGHAAKANILGEKFAWFTTELEEREEPLSAPEFLELCDRYFHRFDEELDQIKLKQSISKNRSNQHISRESAIRMTLEREIGDFNGGGFQFMDLTDAAQYKAFKEWNGNAMSLQHLKMTLISKKNLENKSAMES